MTRPAPLLEVDGLALRRGPALLLAAATLALEPGRSLGLLGEAGCGADLLLRAVLGLLPAGVRVAAGTLRLAAPRPGFLPRDGRQALNPARGVGEQLAARLRRAGREAVALRPLLEEVELPAARRALACLPHELSALARQRVLLAAALAGDPALLVAEDPTAALDVTAQQAMLALLRQVAAARGLALLLATRDAGVLAALCGDAAVLYAGRMVEVSPTGNLLADPRHPYTRMLLACHPERARDLSGIPGVAPRPDALPEGCGFAPRCPLVRSGCTARPPALAMIFDGSRVACPFHAEPLPEPAHG